MKTACVLVLWFRLNGVLYASYDEPIPCEQAWQLWVMFGGARDPMVTVEAVNESGRPPYACQFPADPKRGCSR